VTRPHRLPGLLSDDDPRPPEAAWVRQRAIPAYRVEWAMKCNEILMQYGAVNGSKVYSHRHLARWRAASLIRVLVELRVHERWQLAEHVTRGPRGQGYVWSVEYIRRPEDARQLAPGRPRAEH
jgi:hypothetical protein